MADVNQAWDLPHALVMMPRLWPYGLAWLEEPLRTGAAWPIGNSRSHAGMPLAAGENLMVRPALRK